jgi:hypothetical protein
VWLKYSLDGAEIGSEGFSLSQSIGAGGNFSGSHEYVTPVEFSDIPVGATGLQLYWETRVGAQTAATALDVPEGGQSWLLLCTGILAVETLRRRCRTARPA